MQYMNRKWATTTLLSMASLVPSLHSSAEFTSIPLGVPDLVKADFSLDLQECALPVESESDCPSISTASIVVDETSPGHYLVSNLPDTESGSGIGYVLNGAASGVFFSYVWPRGTITPQSTSAVVSYTVPSTITLAAGDTLPVVESSVSGLTSDPSGASVVFDLWHISGTQVLDSVPATIPDIDAQVDGTWRATFRHAWLTSETDDLSGQYYGRFTITFAGGGVMTIPPAPNSLRVQVFP